MRHKKNIFLLAGFITAVFLFLTPVFVFSANSASGNYGLDKTASVAGLSKATDIPTIAGNIIGSALSLISVLFFILVVYGGVKWMLSNGKSEDSQKALDIIISAIIGIIIVLAAYAITNFVFKSVGGIGGGSPTTPQTTPQTNPQTPQQDDNPSGGCNNPACDDTHTCESGECKVKVGETCSDENPCASGLTCINSKCATGIGEGEICSDNGDCQPGMSCQQIFAVDNNPIVKACISPNSSNVGDYCNSSFNYCKSGTHCDLDDNKCVTTNIGDDCNNQIECGVGNLCVNGECVTGDAETDCSGHTDIGDAECDNGLFCIDIGTVITDHECTAPQSTGSNCNRDKECGSGSCNLNTKKCD